MTGRQKAPPPTFGELFFRFGQGVLWFRSQDAECHSLVSDLYLECAIPSDSGVVPDVRCRIDVLPSAGQVAVKYSETFALNLTDFALALFGQMKVEAVIGRKGGTILRMEDNSEIAISDHGLQADLGAPWRWLVAMLCLHLVIRSQKDTIFLHGGSINLGGSGILLAGASSTGKTTLSLALAARGHGFFGDDYAVVKTGSFELLPLRRQLAIRDGPRDPSVDRLLKSRQWPTRMLGDGSIRYLVHPQQLFPNVPTPTRLRTIFYLQGRGSRPTAVPLPATREQLSMLTPFSTTFGASPSTAAFRMTQLIGHVRSYALTAGTIEDTVRYVEELGEADGI